MTIPWLYVIPIIVTTIGLVIGDRMLHTKLRWYRILPLVALLELFAFFGVAYNVVVATLSLLLILVVLFEVRFSKALLLSLLYAVLSVVVILLLMSRAVLFPFLPA